MKRPMETFSLLMLITALILGVLVWRESLRLDKAQTELAAKTQALGELRSELTRHKLGTREQASRPAEISPQLAEVTRQLAELTKKKQEARFRQNALHGYIVGLDRLKLTPEIIAEAKRVILASAHTFEALRSKAERRSLADGDTTQATLEWRSEIKRVRQSTEDELAAVLGKEAAESLLASRREGTINWEIGTDTWDAGATISSEQVQALALAQERVKYERTFWGIDPSPAQIPDPETGLSSQDVAFLAAASPALTTTQRRILVQSLIENNQYDASMRTFDKRQKALWKAAKTGRE